MWLPCRPPPSYSLGFTLAEVLITLAIIGVVAALTIPTLVNNFQKKVIITKLKRANTILNNVIELSNYENGDMSNFAAGEYVTEEITKEYFNTYWLPFFKNAHVDPIGKFPTYGISLPWKLLNGSDYTSSICTNYGAGRIYFKTDDGIGYFMYIFSWKNIEDSEGNVTQKPVLKDEIEIYVDVNAGKGPNIIGKDIFCYTYNTQTNTLAPRGHTYQDKSVNSNCSLTATQLYSGYTCLEKIIRDNWQITYW